jgi:hypothetical protein
MKSIAFLLGLLVLLSRPTATAPQVPERDGVAALVARLEEVLLSGQQERYLDLLSASADREAAASFADSVFLPGATRVAVRERDRTDLVGTLPGDGYRLLVEVFSETGSRGRLATWRVDVRRMSGIDGGASRWGISSQEPLTVLNGLYRLSLNSARQYAAKDLVIESEDLKLSLAEGSVFVSEPDGGMPTALVLIGRGEMEFKPLPASERGQLRIFAGSESLQTPFEAVFLRVNPNDFTGKIRREALTERPVDPREVRRADEIFRQELPRSFGLDLGDLSADTWSLLPNIGDFVAEVRTRRFETLTFARSVTEVEDVSLFDRKNRRNISVYSSRANRQRFGRFYNEDDRADFIARSYDIEASFNPSRRQIDGTTRMEIEIRGNGSATLNLRLAEPLVVRSIYSSEFGRLQSFRIRNQNTIIINLPSIVTRGLRMTLSVSYSGVLDPQPVDRESVAVSPQFIPIQEEGAELPFEDSVLYSNRSYWYPQPGTPTYSLATMRLTVPAGWAVAASGEPQGFVAVPNPKGPSLRQFRFVTPNPARYLSCVLTPLETARDETVHLGSSVEALRAGRRPGVYYDDVRLIGLGQPRMKNRARDLTRTTADLLKFYASLVGEAPYPAITLAVVEGSLPGGHSPAYLAVVSQPGVGIRLSYRDDPAAFMDYPEFFLAHEVAHQWWGQAVGWKNYHEQWLSEGFAQYFAALFAEKARGRSVFLGMMRRMRRFGVERTGEGPIYLGYRIGHIRNDSRAFRAVVYNKAAVVLHQLRRLVGDEAFFRGVRRFYDDWRFRKAGTDDFRRAMEAEVGAPLDRFFERWIHSDALPALAFTYRLEEGEDGRSDAVIRFEQTGPVFDVPVTVTLEYLDRPAVDTLVKVTDRVVEHRVPLTGKLKAITANKDELTLAEIKVVGSGQ